MYTKEKDRDFENKKFSNQTVGKKLGYYCYNHDRDEDVIHYSFDMIETNADVTLFSERCDKKSFWADELDKVKKLYEEKAKLFNKKAKQDARPYNFLFVFEEHIPFHMLFIPTNMNYEFFQRHTDDYDDYMYNYWYLNSYLKNLIDEIKTEKIYKSKCKLLFLYGKISEFVNKTEDLLDLSLLDDPTFTKSFDDFVSRYSENLMKKYNYSPTYNEIVRYIHNTFRKKYESWEIS